MISKSTDYPVFFSDNKAELNEYPTPADKCIKGQPTQRTWNHFASADEAFFAGIWEAEPGSWKVSYTEVEFCQILSGSSVLRHADCQEFRLQAGDNFVIPAGFSGEWEVLETTRKIYAIYEPAKPAR
ncbi:MAG: cupin domain-containing protein [Woeseia sp.]